MSGGPGLLLMLRVVVSLAVVVALMVVAGRMLQRRGRGFGSRRTGAPVALEIVAQQSLGRHGAIAVVRVADQHMVIGSTEQSIGLLSEVRGDLLAAPPAAALTAPNDDVHPLKRSPRTRSRHSRAIPRGNSARMTLLDELRELTVRRS